MAAVSEQADAVAAAVVAVSLAAVAVSLAVAAGFLVAVVAVAVLAAADSDVPSLLEPRSSLFRGPTSWPRDSRICRSPPTLLLQLRIPEPSEVPLGWSLVDSAVLCRPAEAASESWVEPRHWARLEPPVERSCKAKQQSVSSEGER